MSAESNEAEHPHAGIVGVPERLPAEELRALSKLDPGQALIATATEWLVIGAAVGVSLTLDHPLVYALAIVLIGARQHALTVLAHDASHFRYLPNKRANDFVANLLLAWPVFISVHGFRKFHGAHHKFLGEARDGNRTLWRTHDEAGELVADWVYPKSRGELLALLARRTALFTGLRWILRGLLSIVVVREPKEWKIGRVLTYALVAGALSMGGWWLEFGLLWVLPLCTWHVTAQYIRLIAEHSAVHSEDSAYAATRTTIPRRLEALLILPRNIGYHIEHHWYPSVPYYNLPALHARLMRQPRFREHAQISRSVWTSMLTVTRR